MTGQLFLPHPAGGAELIGIGQLQGLIGAEGYLASDVERAFAVIDLKAKHWDLNFGLGVNRGSPDHPIAKLILGVHP